MISFKQFLIEAPSWEDHLRQIGHVVRNPDLFGVEFVDTDTFEPGRQTTGTFNPNTTKIKIATKRDEKTSPLFKDSTFLNSDVLRGEVYPSVDDDLAHEGAHLIQKVRQIEKHGGPFRGMKGREGPYLQQQVEVDARSAARGSRIVSTYNQRLADIMVQFPGLSKTPEGIDSVIKTLRGFNFSNARDAEKARLHGAKDVKITHRRAKQTDKQTMAAIYAAEKGLPQNITDPEVMKAFIERHKVKTPEATTPTTQATPSGARRAMSTRPTVSAIAAASGVGGMATGINAATDVSGILTPPQPRDRMQGEKAWGTDTGLGFDLGDDGELVASPEGFKAVRQREKEGRSFPGPYAR